MPSPVLVVSGIYPNPADRLAAIFVHRQVVALRKQGLDCRVLHVLAAPPRFPLWLRRRNWLRYHFRALSWPRALDGVPVQRVFFRRRWTPNEDVVPAMSRALSKAIRRLGLPRAVLYAHWYWPGGAAALPVAKEFGYPLATIARGGDMHYWLEDKPQRFDYVKAVLQDGDLLLANCEDLRQRMADIEPSAPARAQVVYNGCDSRFYSPSPDSAAMRRRLGLPSDAYVLTFCGSLDRRKGMPELTAAWKELSGSHPGWYLVAVGSQPDAELANQLRLACPARTILTGRVPATRVRDYLRCSDLYLQPSLLEGLSNATMEAMAVGLPVITTETCGQVELIETGRNGILIPPSDSNALKNAIEVLANDPERSGRMATAARETVVQRFDNRKEAARLANLLRALEEA